MRSAVRVRSSALSFGGFAGKTQINGRASVQSRNIHRKLHIFDRTQEVIFAIRGASLMSKNGSIAPQVNPYRNLRTLAGPAPHLDLPTQTFDPLAHRRETHAGPHRGGIEPSAVVNNLCQHLLVLHS